MRTTPFLIFVTLTTGACFQYFPVDDSAPLPEAGAEVRIQLESPQSLDLGTMTLNEVSSVEGHVHASDADTLSLFSNKLRTFYGFRQRTNGAVFYFDRSDFRTLEQRELVVWKTAVSAGSALVGMGLFWYFATDLGRGGESGGQLPPTRGFGRVVPIPLSTVLPLIIP